jgi:predicted DNA-binding transcriptional regulator YafY
MRPPSDRISAYPGGVADVTERLLALLSTLQTGRTFTGPELAGRLGVSARTVRRDVDRLRRYGYPVDAQPGPGGRYALSAGRTMPPLVLDDGEAVAALVGLALLAATTSGDADTLDNAATRAYGKLDQVFPARLRHQAAALRASLETRAVPVPGVAIGVLAQLAEAIADHAVVRFDYRDQRDAASERRVEPHRQVHLRMRWYVLAWDLDRDDWRVFRLDRITALTRTTACFEPRPLPAGSAVEYLRQGMNAERQSVRLTVQAREAAVADAFKDYEPDVSTSGDATEVALRTDTWTWLLPQLARLDADFTFTETRDRAAIATFARRLQAATRRTPASTSGSGSTGRVGSP